MPATKRKQPRTDPRTGLLRADVRIENNRHRTICLTCGEQIPARQGQRVDDAAGDVRGYRHPCCPEPKYQQPKSPKRPPHKLGAHILHVTRKGGEPARVCAVKGCKYFELWDDSRGDWLPPANITNPRGGPSYRYADSAGFAAKPAEPGLIQVELFA